MPRQRNQFTAIRVELKRYCGARLRYRTIRAAFPRNVLDLIARKITKNQKRNAGFVGVFGER